MCLVDELVSRQFEIAKYGSAYKDPAYGMAHSMRRPQAKMLLRNLMPFSSYLDVGCGRGEMIDFARNDLGVCDVIGTEVVDCLIADGVCYAEAHDLPFDDDRFDVVSSLDVLEHLVEADIYQALTEMRRVAIRAAVLTTSNISSKHRGEELHPTRWAYSKWRRVLEDVFEGWKIEQPTSGVSFNQPFVVTLG